MDSGKGDDVSDRVTENVRVAGHGVKAAAVCQSRVAIIDVREIAPCKPPTALSGLNNFNDLFQSSIP